MLINLVNLLFVITIAQNSEPQMQSLKNITVTRGMFSDKIIVEWEKTESPAYTVMRSQFKNKEFTAVTQTADLKFEDLTAEKGVKYWYKVLPAPEFTADKSLLISDEEYTLYPEPAFTEAKLNGEDIKKTESEIPSKPPVGYSGYTSIDSFTGVKLADLMKLKKAKLKTPSGAEDKKIQKKHLEYIKPFYMNQVKLSLFMIMARPYLDNGDLKILNDFDAFEVKKEKNQIFFYDKSWRFMVVFESNKFTRIISDSKEPDLINILLRNADLFCISSGKSFIVDKCGITRLVNTFDAVGLSTGYLKNDSEWRSRTIMLATSRPDLKEKLKSISQKGREGDND